MSNYKGAFRPNEKNNNWNIAFDLVRPKTKVLDIGCSSGNFGEALIHYKECVVDGVEPDQEDAKQATQKLRNVFSSSIEDVLETMIVNKKKYDHVVFLDVIEHLYRPSEVLKRLREILAPDGTVVFSLPNMGHQSVRIMLLAGDFEYGKTGLLDNTHLHFYTEREIHRVFGEAGFFVNSLDRVVVAYDKEVITNELKKIGVTEVSESLIRVLSRNNAHTYQFVGDAKVSTDKKAIVARRKFQSPSPKNTIKEAYDKKIMERELFFKQEIDKRNNIIKEKNKVIRDKDLQIAQLEKRGGIINRFRKKHP